MDRIEQYVRENYRRKYGERPLIITDCDNHWEVKSNKDESPLILSKKI